MTSSPGSISARNTAAIASVAPHVTVISRSGSTGMSYQRRYFSAIAWRRAGVPQVIAYWLMSPWIAAHAASFIGAGIGKSGKPCARLIAPCCCGDAGHLADDRFGERGGAVAASAVMAIGVGAESAEHRYSGWRRTLLARQLTSPAPYARLRQCARISSVADRPRPPSSSAARTARSASAGE